MSEQGGVKLTLTHRPKDNESVNGLAALFGRLIDSDGEQYVLLRVVPVDTLKRRYDGRRIVTVEIRAIEPLVNEADRVEGKALMERATRLRLDRAPKAADVPEDMLADLDTQQRGRNDEPPNGAEVDTFLGSEGNYEDSLRTAGAFDDI